MSPSNRKVNTIEDKLYYREPNSSEPIPASLRLLGWAQQNLADEGLWGLRYQHCYHVRYVFWLQHLRFILSRVWAQFGVH